MQVPRGDEMFAVARQGLVDMAGYIPAYRGAASRPDKFCHGFGIFQLDLQFFKNEPDYFLSRKYADFDTAVAKCVGELKSALKRIGWQAKTSLSDAEMAAVAIAYNTGRYDPAKGLKQGYFDGRKYYGENYFDYLQMAKSARFPAAEAAPSRDARALPAKAKKKARKPARKAVTAARKAPGSAKKSVVSAKTAATPAKKAAAAAKKAGRPAKKAAKAANKAVTPVKKAAKPVKKAASPAKKAAGAAKKADQSGKRATALARRP